MANQNSTQLRPGSDHAPLAVLSDADLASRNPLAAKVRATTLVPDIGADAERLADRLFTEFRAAWAAGDHDRMSEVIVDAIVFDDAHRGGPRLMDEIRGITTPADDRMTAADMAAHDAASHVRQYRRAA
ncbi:hypothetical protein [Streptomyces sp. NPDC001205]